MFDWFLETLRTYPEIALFLALALGFYFGKFKFRGIGLGAVTATLLAGVLIGQAGITISPPLKATVFLMFLFAVGYGVGPQFVRGIAKDGLPQALFSVVQCVLCLAVPYLIVKIAGYDLGYAAGLYSGSQTISAAMGLSTDAINRLGGEPGQTKALLDIYYKHPSAAEIVASSTALGREIYAYTSEAASSVAGRERRDILARTVDETARRVENPEILAIACGHLREAGLSQALAAGKVKRWVGLDQDPVSVGIVNRDLAGTAVEAIDGSVRGILRRAYRLGTFDLVYASGLYDYLPLNVGVRLLQRAMELLKPGGEFLFANFSDEITTDGYIETFMDWPLILRSADDMWDIINAAVDRNAVEARVFYGSNRNIVYGVVRRRDS